MKERVNINNSYEIVILMTKVISKVSEKPVHLDGLTRATTINTNK